MIRTLALLYGVACYLMMGAASLYFGWFLIDISTPRADEPSWSAVIVDLLLIVLFGVQHSVMARPAFKRAWTRLVPSPVERSTYVLASSVVVAAVCYFWQPLGGPSGSAPWPALRWAMWALFGLGAVIVVATTFQTDHFDLSGLRQVWDYYRARPASDVPFKVAGMYRYVRHPLMAGLLLMFWSIPVMTLDRLLFASAMTAYILIALHWEERDLTARFGQVYAGYRQRVPKLIPWGGRCSMIAIGQHPEGCVLPVRAQPGARNPGVKGEQGGALKLAVTAPPEDGRANEALLELLRELLNLKRSQVELISGHTSREKKFLIRGLGREELATRVTALLA